MAHVTLLLALEIKAGIMPSQTDLLQHALREVLDDIGLVLANIEWQVALASSNRAATVLIEDELRRRGKKPPVASIHRHPLTLVIDSGHGLAAELQAVRMTRRSLYWIDTETGEWTREQGKDLYFTCLHHLDTYNQDSRKVSQRKIDERVWEFQNSLEKHELSGPLADVVVDQVLPHFITADEVAMRYQKPFFRTGAALHMLEAFAVFCAAGIILLRAPSSYFLLELSLLTALWAVWWVARRRDLKRKWLDYRHLAERLRALMYLLFAELQPKQTRPPAFLRLSAKPDFWIYVAIRAIFGGLPTKCVLQGSFEDKKAFVLNAWIEDQRRYYLKESARQGGRNRLFLQVTFGLFLLTLVAALIHWLGIGHGNETFTLVADICTFALPAAAASVAGIRTFHEFARNAAKYGEMADDLEQLKVEIANAKDIEALSPLLTAAHDLMLAENTDWRVASLLEDLHVC